MYYLVHRSRDGINCLADCLSQHEQADEGHREAAPRARSPGRPPSEAAGLVRRARVVLLSDDGVAAKEIAVRLSLSPEQVSRIRGRFRGEGVAGLMERKKAGRKDHAVPAATRRPSNASSRWRCRHRRRGAAAGRRAFSPKKWASPTDAWPTCSAPTHRRMLDRISTTVH